MLPLLMIFLSSSLREYFLSFPYFEVHLHTSMGEIYYRNFFTSNLSFVKRTHGGFYFVFPKNTKFASKYGYVDRFSSSFCIQFSMALLYCDRTSRSHIIFSGIFHITNFYCSIFPATCVPREVPGPLANIFFSPLQSEIKVKFAPQKYFLKLPIFHLTVSGSPTKVLKIFPLRQNKLGISVVLPGNYQIMICLGTSLVTLFFLPQLNPQLAESLIPS